MQSERPTHVRHYVIFAAFLMSVLLYLHRFCISLVQTYIQEDLNLSTTQISWILSAFFLTYALAQVPSGWLTDRFGSRLMLTLYILLWSVFTGLTGAASAFAAVFMLRLGFGFAQAGAYPTAASIVSKWVPFTSRGLASGIIAMGGRFGNVLAMFATGYLLVLLTPATTPPTLDAQSIMNGQRLCYELATRPDEESAASRLDERCFKRLSPSGQELAKRYANQYANALKAEQQRLEAEGKSPKNAAPETQPLATEDVAALLQEINSVIASEPFFEADELQDVNIEKEARRLARLGTNRSPALTHRMNRLVLEGLHRQSIKKLYIAGWRPLMFLYGSVGIVVAAIVWWSCRKTPADHPKCNAAEVALIAGETPLLTEAKAKPPTVPIIRLMASFSMWMCCLTQWFTNIGWAFLPTLAPRYFINEHEMSIEMVGTLAALPPVAGALGMFSGGPVTDHLTRLIGLRWGRALPITLSRFAAMGAYIVCLFGPTPFLAVTMFACVAFFTGIGTPAVWAFNQDVGGKCVGSVLGWGNMWGNLGAAITAPLLLWAAGSPERWDYAFATCAGAFLVSGIVALGINATVPIVIDDPIPNPKTD